MRQRVISSLVGLVILGVVLVFIGTKLFNLVIALIGLVAIFEILRVTGCTKSKSLTVLSFAISLVIPFGSEYLIREWMIQIIFIFFFLFFTLLIFNSTSIRVGQASTAFLFSIFIPLFFSCAVFMRDMYGPVAGGFYLLVALGSAWLCDTGAYFVGVKYGRHKLAPAISPAKTIEGAVGGLIVCTVFMLLIALGFSAVMGAAGVSVSINYGMTAIVTPVCGVMGMLGDLSASVVKRQFGAKDFGTIMPGHGGILDRFDSVMFTLPSVFIIAYHVSLIVVL